MTLAFQAWQRPAQAAEESCLEEDSCLAQEPVPAPPDAALDEEESTFWFPVEETKTPDAGA
jgi:hypothetical protein